MTKPESSQPDLEKQEEEKTERTRKILKYAILVSVLTLVAIVAAAIPMALEKLPAVSSRSFAQDGDPERPAEDVNPIHPTDPPSAAPTATIAPTLFPTVSPAPTDENPSSRPTIAPTTSPPTMAPTPLASEIPTTSFPPTVAPIDPNFAFKLRLFWQSGYYWQESWNEVWHCVECTRCQEYGAGDGVEHGCERVAFGSSSNCAEGDMFWIMGCDDNEGVFFNILTNPGSGFQVRLDNTNLCLQRGAVNGETGQFSNRLLRAAKCDSSNARQLWAPFESVKKFELRPLNQAGRSEAEAECVSQLHHPKDTEVISMHGCKLSRIYETRYWEQL